MFQLLNADTPGFILSLEAAVLVAKKCKLSFHCRRILLNDGMGNGSMGWTVRRKTFLSNVASSDLRRVRFRRLVFLSGVVAQWLTFRIYH